MKPIALGQLLDRVTKKMGVAVRLREELAQDLWPRVVGTEIARETVAGPVRDRVLLVRAANPVLAHQLSLMEREILQRYAKLLGGRLLRGIHWRIGEVPRPEEAGPGRAIAPPRELSPEEETYWRGLAEEIGDPEAAAAFLRAGIGWAKHRQVKAPGQEETDYLRLLTDKECWPTTAEIDRSLAAIEPSRRDQVRRQAVDILRARIERDLTGGVGKVTDLRGRNDLRRLALALGYPLATLDRGLLLDLLSGAEHRPSEVKDREGGGS